MTSLGPSKQEEVSLPRQPPPLSGLRAPRPSFPAESRSGPHSPDGLLRQASVPASPPRGLTCTRRHPGGQTPIRPPSCGRRQRESRPSSPTPPVLSPEAGPVARGRGTGQDGQGANHQRESGSVRRVMAEAHRKRGVRAGPAVFDFA